MKKLLNLIILYLTTKKDISSESFLSYFINGDRHYSIGEGLLPYRSKNKEIKFSIKFSNTANVHIPNNPRQINKAIGLREGTIPNKNSVILGFSTNLTDRNEFELWLFVNYDNSFEHVKIIGNFETNKWINDIILGIEFDYYYIVYDGLKYKLPRLSKDDIPDVLGVIRPYFGGKEKNPMGNSINIQIRL